MRKFDEYLSKGFENTYEFCDRDISKFCHVAKNYLSMWALKWNKKRSSPATWQWRASQTPTRNKLKSLADFGLQNLDLHHDLYIQSDTLLLEDIFKSLRNKCLCLLTYSKVSDLAHFLSASRLAWQTCLKKTEVKLKLLAVVDILLMVVEDIMGGIYHAVLRFAKANNKYMEDHDLCIELSYLIYWDVNNLYGRALSQKLL